MAGSAVLPYSQSRPVVCAGHSCQVCGRLGGSEQRSYLESDRHLSTVSLRRHSTWLLDKTTCVYEELDWSRVAWVGRASFGANEPVRGCCCVGFLESIPVPVPAPAPPRASDGVG